MSAIRLIAGLGNPGPRFEGTRHNVGATFVEVLARRYGIALREEMLLDEASGAILNPGFLEHKFTSIVDFPPIEVLFAGEPDPIGPYGAKALGEPPVVPVFAAVANGVANACGVWLHETPFTPQRVLQAIHDQSGGRP